MTPRVTVVICLRNEVRHVQALLGRLGRMQSRETDIEFVLVDDMSDDGTGAALRDGAAELSGLTILTGAGVGVAAARNLAVSRAGGDFLWFGDGDDDWDPTITAALLDRASGARADVVVCNARKKIHGQPDELIEDAPVDEVVDGEEFFARLLDAQVQGHLWNKLFRRSVLGADPFPPTRAHSDLGGLLALAPRVRAVAFLPVDLYSYHIHAGSILNSSGYRWNDLLDCEAVARRSAEALRWSARDGRLAYFSLIQVTLPLLNESVRRESSTNRPQLAEVRARCRRAVTAKGFVQLLRHRKLLAAVRAAAFKASPRLYIAAYRRYRMRRWGSVDAAIGGRPTSS